MTASPASSKPSSTAPGKSGRIGLVVFGSIASGFVLGLLLVLVVFAGGEESQITGSALLALGAGFILLAAASSRFTDQPQRWALAPGIASAVVGLAVLLLSPGNRALGLAGWVWPVLLLLLVGWSFWGARRSLHNWSRRALLYPALFVLLLVAVGGAYETVAEATSSNPAPAGRTYLVNGHRLYLNCAGAGDANRRALQRARRTDAELGLGAAVAFVEDTCVCVRPRRTRVERCSGRSPGRPRVGLRPGWSAQGCGHLGAICAGWALHRRHLRARLRSAVPPAGCGGRLDRLGYAVSVRSPELSPLLLGVATRFGAASITFSCRIRTPRTRHRLRDAASRRS